MAKTLLQKLAEAKKPKKKDAKKEESTEG